jgi:hypothetical protein
MVTNKASALQSPALYEQEKIYPWTEFTGLLISGIIFIIILNIIFKWKDLSIIFRKVQKYHDQRQASEVSL